VLRGEEKPSKKRIAVKVVAFTGSDSRWLGVVNYGLPIAVGTPTEVLANQKVIEAYLGVKKAEK
jgi:hypothetical protein